MLVLDGQEYGRVSLGSLSIPPGGYLVIGNASVLAALPAGTPSILIPDDTVHNGPAGAVALFDTLTNTLVDALAYEGTGTFANPGSNRVAVINGAPGTYSLVEGQPLAGTVADTNSIRVSVSRYPNGRDTNNALTDWILTSTPTPAAANIP